MSAAPLWPRFEQPWAEHAVFHVTLNNVDVWTVQWSKRRPDKGKILLLRFGEADHMHRVLPYNELASYAEVFPDYYDPIRMYLEMNGVFNDNKT
jgi:hypothetical protein